MESWNFKIEKGPSEITDILESELNSIGGFVFDTRNQTTFRFRKRILYAWYMAFQNWTIVSGEMSNSGKGDSTMVKISFNQHFLIQLIIYTHILLGLGLILGLLMSPENEPSTYVVGGLIIGLGIVVWFATRRKFKNDAEKYRELLTDTFGL